MIIKSSEIRKELSEIIPKLNQIWLMDPQYEKISLSDLKAIVEACSVRGFKFMPDVWDCDNYSLQLHARIRRLQYDLIKAYPGQGRQFPWMFCEAVGVHNTQGVHAVNVALTADAGIQYIEPQTDECKPVFNGNIFFIKG